MRYPTLPYRACEELAAQMANGGHPPVEPYVTWLGRGDDVDLQDVERAAEEITHAARTWPESTDRDRFEGKTCTRLAEALAHVPTEVLDDRGFWRFLALRYFWEFIAWREAEPFANGNHLKYVDAATNTESVLPRMFLRARAVGGSDHAALAAAIPRGGDFWRSHVIRVRTGTAPPVARALARKQATDRLMTTPLREAAKRLNRTWTNVVLHMYDDTDAARLIDAVWSDDGS